MVAGGQQHHSEVGVRLKEPTALEEGRAFIQELEVDPTDSGPLDGLSFAVKDLIDIDSKSAYGNPSWRYTHSPATVSAVKRSLYSALHVFPVQLALHTGMY